MAAPAPSLREIRHQASLAQITIAEPETETCLNQDYTDRDIDREIRNIPRIKAHGNDGIPGESYKGKRQWAVKPATRLANIVKRETVPERPTEGEVVYIYKNKGDAGECGNYIPICLTQIV